MPKVPCNCPVCREERGEPPLPPIPAEEQRRMEQEFGARVDQIMSDLRERYPAAQIAVFLYLRDLCTVTPSGQVAEATCMAVRHHVTASRIGDLIGELECLKHDLVVSSNEASNPSDKLARILFGG